VRGLDKKRERVCLALGDQPNNRVDEGGWRRVGKLPSRAEQASAVTRRQGPIIGSRLHRGRKGVYSDQNKSKSVPLPYSQSYVDRAKH